ncbi:MAG: hypothetical protein OHK0015_30400 [Chloroflexi bacterium OHK40]
MRLGFVMLAIVLGVAHFFGTFMLGFITGTTQSSNRPLIFILNVLTFPLWLLPSSDSGPLAGNLGWLLWIGLSLLWGVGLSALFWGLVVRLGRAL